MDIDIDKTRIPKHVAIIMDGNGRWAKERNLSRTEGHIAGVKRVEELIDYSSELGVKVMTLFTFSTENWNRPEHEVRSLMETITAVLQAKLKKLKNLNTKFQIIGRRERIPESVIKAMHVANEETKDNEGMIINLAFNYGSRLEIVDAIRDISKKVQEGVVNVEDINEELVSRNLYTQNLPDPDLLIRTSGEKRISNFLLWQLSYAELYFTDIYWPDFSVEEFNKAIIDYQNRDRRFGHSTTAQ